MLDKESHVPLLEFQNKLIRNKNDFLNISFKKSNNNELFKRRI